MSRAGLLFGAALIAALLSTACDDGLEVRTDGPVADWTHTGGDAGGSRYSPVDQIDRDNVGRLEVAWSFRTGDLGADPEAGADLRIAFQATPILVDDTLFFCTPTNRVFALDAESGVERWRHDPMLRRDGLHDARCRGVASWREARPEVGAACQRRIFSATMDGRLFGLDAETGRPCADFGVAGTVSLHRGLGEITPGEVTFSSPPEVVGDVVVMGSAIWDNRRIRGPGGVVRGFDARSGALRWAFDPVPPGTPAPPPGTDGDVRYHRGTPNAWSILSSDADRDLVFLPMGSASPDFYGGQREGIDYYASSVVALRGSTGEVVWHFPAVHHDLWDYDVSSQPSLAMLRIGGRAVPALVQATKMGHVFLLNRETGAPLYPVEERPVPGSSVPGETAAPTQPFPTHPPPLHPGRISPDDAWGLTPFDRGWCRERIASLRNEGIFTPPSLEGSIQYPGVAGGMNWGGVALEPSRRRMVTAINRMPNVQTLVPRAEIGDRRTESTRSIVFPQGGTPYASHQGVLVSPLGIPCSPPPWGTLIGVDLDTGETAWEVPLGTTRGNAPWPFWFEFGLPAMGGPIITGGDLVFIGAALDGYLRALDLDSGEELWRHRLPAGGQATPMTYRLREDSRQYVVIAAGGHATLGTKSGDWLLAFALP